MSASRRVVIAALALLLAACGASKLLLPYARLEVQEVRRSQQCRTGGEESRALLFPDRAALAAWQQARGIQFGDGLAEAPYAVVEVGARPSGGYGVAVSRPAVLRGGLLILSATFMSPRADALVPQVLTSPCVLVRLPPGRYSTIEVQDPEGAVIATGAVAGSADAAGEGPSR